MRRAPLVRVSRGRGSPACWSWPAPVSSARPRARARSPAFEVRAGRFLREVEARGTLKAVKATPIVVPPESGRAQKVAWLAKDGASLAAGETIVEFDPYDAQRTRPPTGKPTSPPRGRASRRRGRRAPGRSARSRSTATSPRDDLRRAETYKLTDESLYSRHEIIESALTASCRRRSWTSPASGSRRAASCRRPSARSARSRRARHGFKIEIADKGLRSLRITAPHDGLLVLDRSWTRRDDLRRRHALAGAEDRRAAGPVAARGEGVRARGGRGGAPARPRRAPRDRGSAGRRSTRRRSRRSSRSPSRAIGDRR